MNDNPILNQTITNTMGAPTPSKNKYVLAESRINTSTVALIIVKMGPNNEIIKSHAIEMLFQDIYEQAEMQEITALVKGSFKMGDLSINLVPAQPEYPNTQPSEY